MILHQTAYSFSNEYIFKYVHKQLVYILEFISNQHMAYSNSKVMRKGKKDPLTAPLLNPIPGFGITINELSIFHDQENHQNITTVTVYKCKQFVKQISIQQSKINIELISFTNLATEKYMVGTQYWYKVNSVTAGTSHTCSTTCVHQQCRTASTIEL